MAATNVQAFSGDVEISSNLAVSGSKFTYDNTNTTVFTGTASAAANEIGVWNVGANAADNTFIDVWVKSTGGIYGTQMHYRVYNRPSQGNSTRINTFERDNGTIAPVVFRTSLDGDITGGVIRIGYENAENQFIAWRVEVTTRYSYHGEFQVTNTGSAVDGTGLTRVTPAPATELNSNLAVGGSHLFVDTVGGTVGIGSTKIDITDNTLTGAGNGLYIHNPVQGGHLLTLGTQRPWVFEQGLSDASTELCLRSLNSGKKFNIQSADHSNVMTVVATNGGGNVGIGTTNPSKTLDIGFVDYGSPGIRFTHTDPNGIDRRSSGYANYFTGLEAVIERYADKNVRYSGSNVPEVTHRINLGYSDSYNNSTGFYPQFHEMHFEVMNKVGEGDSTATLDRIMTLRGDGNVGIGTTDPKAPLHVNQNKAIINGQMSLQTLNVYKNAGGNSGSQTKRYYRVYVPNSYANFQIILQGFARNYTGSGDIQAWRRQYTVQRNSGAVVVISHDSGENINATGFTFATSTVGSATSVIEVHFDVTFPPKPEAATYISFTAQLMGDTGYFAENTSS